MGDVRRYQAKSTLNSLSPNSNFRAGGQKWSRGGQKGERLSFPWRSCLIAVKQLAFYRTEMTYERGITRFDASVWDPNRPI